MLQYKKKKYINLFFILLSTLLIVSVTPFNKEYYSSIKYKFYDGILSNNVGFSAPQNLINGGLTSSKNTIKLAKKLPKVMSHFLLDKDNREIEKLYIDIEFKDYLVILEDRNKALKNNLGHKFKEVNALFTYKNKKNKAKIRLKGDLIDHWRGHTRLSFRVKLKGDNSINGFKNFSIHKPESRQHPYDQVFQSLVRKVGNLAPNHNYMHVYVNGDYWGVMNIEEHMSKELLEKQGFKDSIIFEFDREEKFWKYEKKVGIENAYNDYRLGSHNLNIEVFSPKKKLNNDLYRKWYSYISSSIIKEEDVILYDLDSFSKNIFLSLMWNNTHALSPQNSRYYFNPYTLKILPITTDQGRFGSLINPKTFTFPYNRILEEKENWSFLDNLNINKMINKLGNLQGEMNDYQSFFPLDEQINTNILKTNIEKIKKNIKYYIKNSKKIQNKENSPTSEQAAQLPEHIYARHYKDGELHVYNLLPDDIKIINISSKNQQITNNILLNGFKEKDEYKPLVIKTDLKGLHDNSISINTEYQGNKRKFMVGFSHLVDDLYNPLLKEFDANSQEYILKVNENTYAIKKGTWSILKPLIINGNLQISDGTKLKFSKDSYLIVNGSISAIGDEESRIVLTSLKDTWKGVYVLNSNRKSVLKYVSISNTKALSDGLLDLTGGVTFYNSNVDILNTDFYNSSAEDSLNIVNSNFLLSGVEVKKSKSDGFDSDFSDGSIENSSFLNIGGDAIDFSGSKVFIDSSNFKKIYDKAISVGEESKVSIQNVIMNSVGVGIASKDGSVVDGNNIKISDYSVSAVMSYRKKVNYNYAKIKLNNIEVDETSDTYIRENNTSMFINGVEIKERSLNVKEMYQDQVMKNDQ